MAFKFQFLSSHKEMSLLEKIISYLFLGLTIAYFLLLIIGFYTFDSSNDFYRSLNIFSGAGNPILWIRILSYTFFIFGLSYVVRFLIKIMSPLFKKARGILDIISSLIKYAALIVYIFFVLTSFGVDTTAVLAGIGIVSLIVGLGAQPLITDIIAGLFIVFENVFNEGDIIVVDGFRGTVKEIGIRTTQIEDAGGNIKVVNNSDIRTLVNMTDQLSIAAVEISIEYGESLERVEAVLKDNLDKIKETIPEIVEGPYYKGVSELGESGVMLKFIAKCEEGSRFQVERDLNRQFKLLFDKNNINIPFPQVTVHQPNEFESAKNSDINKAQEFVEEQKEASQNIDTNPNNKE